MGEVELRRRVLVEVDRISEVFERRESEPDRSPRKSPLRMLLSARPRATRTTARIFASSSEIPASDRTTRLGVVPAPGAAVDSRESKVDPTVTATRPPRPNAISSLGRPRVSRGPIRYAIV
ncbi:hypothetical protein GCM10025867_34410 [Frondihabitans sucicola]|uniref:Uncharacterized protein n=1 Tax=Frondihabitans sucicola TaxID=1268041 RepID=A0ABM8GSE5_9MICO|nr:hypothetical protein GCM10025867_34410 [Frondihabitans sucicola]